MVEAGFGATIVPASALLGGAVRRKLPSFGIEGKPLIRNVGLAAAEFSRLPRVIGQMVQLIKDRFREVRSKMA
jgi:DNA-binding transcriptional LysR family regulator